MSHKLPGSHCRVRISEMAMQDAGGSRVADRYSSTSELESLMAELGLQEEDLDDVVVYEDVVPLDVTRWMAVARVHIDKPYSQGLFFKDMRAAWDLAQDVTFKPLEANMSTLKFNCLGDWECLMQDGPWNFRGHVVVITEYDGITQPSKVKLDTIDIWI